MTVPSAASSQGVQLGNEHYSKHQYRVPMRDHVNLFTTVYEPKDRSRSYPILLNRTPYGVAPYDEDLFDGILGPSSLFGKSGYIVVYQDVRGCFLSEGTFEDVRPIDHGQAKTDESTDAFDTIDWLLKTVPNHNGRVGIWGISYPAFYAAAGLVDPHPAVKAVSPQAPLVDWFMGDDSHHNGALFLNQEFNFDASFGLPRPKPTTHGQPPFRHGTDDAYAFFLNMGPLPEANAKYLHGERAFWNQLMEHGTYDEFWKRRNLLPHLTNVRPAVLNVGGWFDAENLYGVLHVYRQIETHSPPETRNTLVMGPWAHGGWASGDGTSLGPVRFGSTDAGFGGSTSEFYRESIEFPFFEHYLKDRDGWDPAEAWVFETGANLWRRHDAWPPKEAEEIHLYLQENGGLSFSKPEVEDEPFDEYLSDPARPVPYTNILAIDTPEEYMVEDQRFAARRPDVLVYQTGPLTQDVTLVGPIRAELHVSTTGTDSDWIVKLIDVYSDKDRRFSSTRPVEAGKGYQQLVRGDVMRGKFRQSFETPVPFVPGEPTVVPFELQDIYHTFRKGHRIMVQVQSSWFPLVDRNPQTFVDIYHAKPEDFIKATQRVYHSPERPSGLSVRRMPKAD
jgi:putative CocE/NonD family hydrolase